jgi:hypothetical protein
MVRRHFYQLLERHAAVLAKQNRADRHLLRRYGITRAEKNERLQLQGGRCANKRCSASKHGGTNWHTDHSHETGKLRGELCHVCNVMLGCIERHTGRMLGLLDYLDSWKEN